MLSGKLSVMDLNVTEDQLSSWHNGKLNIQDALPHLNANEREFLLTGITEKEWNEAFAE